MNKRHITSALLCLSLLSLAGCSDQSSNKADALSSSKAKSERLAKESSKKKASESEQQKRDSQSQADSASIEQNEIDADNAFAELEATTQESSSATEYPTTSDSDSQQQQTSSQTLNGELPPFDGTLTDFLNKYGMTPAAYKVQHFGMTPMEALQSTPDILETSGEIQTEGGY
ncbi:hypothetical protein [uncultured Ligilactobacillus sp.]|uniref:hypothetical protein n=1 Tax=uncultured Ligilactobacillus sp. TaxID=2837633 RepID=UPI00272A5B7C|nr:hypothetical protein [uncultured Ligilactobacillus sp.]